MSITWRGFGKRVFFMGDGKMLRVAVLLLAVFACFANNAAAQNIEFDEPFCTAVRTNQSPGLDFDTITLCWDVGDIDPTVHRTEINIYLFTGQTTEGGDPIYAAQLFAESNPSVSGGDCSIRNYDETQWNQNGRYVCEGLIINTVTGKTEAETVIIVKTGS